MTKEAFPFNWRTVMDLLEYSAMNKGTVVMAYFKNEDDEIHMISSVLKGKDNHFHLNINECEMVDESFHNYGDAWECIRDMCEMGVSPGVGV